MFLNIQASVLCLIRASQSGAETDVCNVLNEKRIAARCQVECLLYDEYKSWERLCGIFCCVNEMSVAGFC